VTEWHWSRIVFDHVKIGVRDVEASKAFYRTVLGALEIPPLWESEQGGQ
jgi:catechol-2,3-dioxygenase